MRERLRVLLVFVTMALGVGMFAISAQAQSDERDEPVPAPGMLEEVSRTFQSPDGGMKEVTAIFDPSRISGDDVLAGVLGDLAAQAPDVSSAYAANRRWYAWDIPVVVSYNDFWDPFDADGQPAAIWAMNTWNSVTGTAFQWELGPATDAFVSPNCAANPDDGINSVAFSPLLDDGVLGVTCSSYLALSNGNFTYEFDMLIDFWTYWSVETPTPSYLYDLYTVMLHEFGHALGLGHSSDGTVMQVALGPGEQMRTLQPDDVAGIRALYPPAAAPTATHTPTNVPTSTPTATPTSVPTATGTATPTNVPTATATATATQSSAPVLITSSPAIIGVGESVDIDFVVSVPSGTAGYGAYAVDITYDPSKASASCIAGRATCNSSFASNMIRLVDINVSGFTGGVIHTVRFTGTNPGAFSFSYASVTCTNPAGAAIQGCSGSGGGIQVEGGSVPPPTATTTTRPSSTPTPTVTRPYRLFVPQAAKAGTPSGPPPSTPTPTPTPTRTPTPPAQATATPTFTAVPTATPTVVDNSSAALLRPYWDAYLTAQAGVYDTQVTTYEQALVSTVWYDLLHDTRETWRSLQDFIYIQITTGDACSIALNTAAQRSHFYYGGLLDSIRPNPFIPGSVPTGQHGWNGVVEYWQPRFFEAVEQAATVCGYD